MSEMSEHDVSVSSGELSRRAARRLIQRAFVLAGRDRHVRQQIREAQIVSLWLIEDWGFDWTVLLDRGHVHFERRPAKRPDVTLTWRAAEGFFRQVEAGSLTPDELQHRGPAVSRRMLDSVCQAFCASFQQVLQNPVDENGDPLV